MKIIDLIENIRKEYIYILSERDKIRQLNSEVTKEIDFNLKTTWIVRNQRYLCDHLNDLHLTNIIEELNQIENVEFVDGQKKFGSDAVFISQILQYLRSNPKLVSYLLFFSEKMPAKISDFLCKVIVSTIYSHCYLDEDKVAILDIMEELIEIYINFYGDVRKQIYTSNSSFNLIYKYFCDELSDLKAFYKLVLYSPVTTILSDDSFYLDLDRDRVSIRLDKEKLSEIDQQEYNDHLDKCRELSIKKLHQFVQNFISSLKAHVFAFPQTLALLIIRIYSKLIERLEFSNVYAICIDLIFNFLICPAITNPDLYGITDLHINNTSKNNLIQCANIIQCLTFSKWEDNNRYAEVCDLFDKDCLSFVIDHILSIFHNISLPKSLKMNSLPYFLISGTEIKYFFQYIDLFLNNNSQEDSQLNHFYSKLSVSMKTFINDLKLDKVDERKSKKSKSTEKLDVESSSYQSLEELLSSKNFTNIILNVLVNINQVFQIENTDYDSRMVGMLNDREFLTKINEKHVDFVDNFNTTLSEIDEIFKKETNQQEWSVDSTQLFDFHSFLNLKESYLNENFNIKPKNLTDKLIDFSPEKVNPTEYSSNLINSLENLNLHKNEVLNFETEKINDFSASLGKIETMFLDKYSTNEYSFGEVTEKLNSIKQDSDKNSSNKKSFFSLNSLKNIKDKVKTISMKDHKPNFQPNKYSSIENLTNTELLLDLPKERFDLQSVKEKTIEILDKYRSKNNNELILKNTCLATDVDSLGGDMNEIHAINYIHDIKGKLRKLMCNNNMFSIYQSYRFLNLENRNYFIMFLKIILSQCSNMCEKTNSVLIMDTIRILETIDNQQFLEIFNEIENDLKMRNFYTIYLIKSQQHLLQTIHQLKSVELFIRKDQYITNFIVISSLIERLLQNKILDSQNLLSKFCDPSTMSDEKASLVNNIVTDVEENLKCNVLSEEQQFLARHIIEHNLMDRVYLHTFYPNGDIDKMRDQILYQQIDLISKSITHSSELLKIPRKYYTTSPWPSAQAELHLLSAYKTPRDKVQCVLRCCSHIMTLLNTSENSIPSADDLLPVLIFVVIKANPLSILSTIQYVNTFHSSELIGEEAYYWTQFCSVVEFIKTMLNQQ